MVQERDYSQLTPQELNDEFRALYEQIPKVFIIDPYTFDTSQVREGEGVVRLIYTDVDPHQEVKRRERSEHKKNIEMRLVILLERALITKSFRDFILNRFGTQYDTGLDKDIPESDRLGWVLDLENPGSGGVFNSSSVKRLEKVAFKILEDDWLWVAQEVENMLRKALGNEGYKRERQSRGNAPLDPEKDLLGKWKREFVEKYGDEP